MGAYVDTRPASFAAEATRQLELHDVPCRVATSRLGVGMFAARNIMAGECVLRERPLTLTVAAEARAHICAVCLADSRCAASRPRSAWPLGCERCASLSFCSERCSMAAASRHDGPECAALAAIKQDLKILDELGALGDLDHIGDLVTQAIRILSDRTRGGDVDIGPAGKLGYSSYMGRLVGVMPSTEEGRVSLNAATAATLRAMPESARVPFSELAGLLTRHQCNLYGLSGSGGESVGSASFTGFFQLFNHACCPNLVFDCASPERATDGSAPTFALMAAADIAEGTELCISYMCTDREASSRSDHLEAGYGFRCRCDRCACDASQGTARIVRFNTQPLRSSHTRALTHTDSYTRTRQA